MSSVEQDDSAGAENGSITRRTRSGRPSKSPALTAAPKSTRSKKLTQKPIFEESQTLQEMSAGLDNFFAQEDIGDQEDFDMPASDGSEQHIKNDSPNANISRALDEGSNGSMDGMLKTCFEDGVSGELNEPMDVSIMEDSSNVNLESEDETNDKEIISSDKEAPSSDKEGASSDKEAASSDKEPASSDVEEVAEETSDDVEGVEEDQAVVDEPPSDDVVEDVVEDVIEDVVKDVIEVVPEVVEVAPQVVEVVPEVVEVVPEVVEVVPEVVQEPAPEVMDVTLNASEEMEHQENDITTIISTDDDKSNDSKKDQEMEEQGQEHTRDDDTEVVSEDELPGVEKPEVKDAENVSDDELPGPKPADLPADTEVVSEDELPSSKKEQSSRKRKAGSPAESGYDPGSPTSEGETTAKKQALLKDGESKPQANDKKSTEEKPAKKKALPELDKYWKAVNDDASDFTGWTYLLQYVDQESDVEAAREAYDAFLSHYPYCYGYWRKYADYEKRKGSKKKCLEVLERGLRGIPLSVDLWIHYLNHVKTTRPEEHDHIRQQYERAIAACGLEFRSDRLWESFIKWETENGSLLKVTTLYDKLLMTPTLGYTSHFDNFQEHILANAPHSCITTEEFLRLRGEVRKELKSEPPLDSDPDIPPGEEEADDHVRSEEEGSAIKERIVSLRRKVHKMTVEQVAQRWNFEEGIKRPYFHVKPLERCQLKNWKAYLQWEEQQQGQQRTLVLYERCLIACALYEDFWLKLVQYLERCTAIEPEEAERQVLITRTRDVLERACTIHHVERPALHVHWAAFEERHGVPAKAADILEKLDKVCPNLLQVACRRINLERRRGDLERCSQLYEQYIAQYNKQLASSMTVKYARFLQRVRRDPVAAVEALRLQAARDPTCQRLYLQMMDIKLCTGEDNLKDALRYIEEYLAVEGIDNESRLLFMQRKAELLEEFGDNLVEGQAALLAYQALSKQQHKKKNKEKNSSGDNSGSKKKSSDTTVAPPLPPSTPNAGSGAPGGYGNNYGASQGQGQAPAQQQQQQYEGGPGYPQQQQQQPYHQWGPTYHHPSQYHHNPWNPYPNYY